MFFEILIALLIGILAGVFTGLIPGIHINLVSILLLSFSPFLLQYTTIVPLGVFIISMSVTHTFLDSIPAIFLGAPEEATALGVLPGHRMLLKGEGYNAVKLTVIGSFFAVLLSIALFPLLIPVVNFVYPLIRDYIGFILIGVVLFMVLRDRNIVMAFFVFLISGVLGIITLNFPNLQNPLFPLLSGLFGISTLIISLLENQKIPKQKITRNLDVKKSTVIKALLSGEFSGFLTAVFPGLGAGTAAVISLQITRKLDEKGFLILIGAINTVNFVLSLVTLYVLDKARNGSIIAVQKLVPTINLDHIILFLVVAVISAAVSAYLALEISKVFSRLISRVNYKALIISVIILISVLVAILTGPIGILVLIVSTAIGILPVKLNVARIHSMGCLLLPVIFYFIL